MFDGMTVNNDHLNLDDHKETGTNDHGVICATFEDAEPGQVHILGTPPEA